MGKRLLTASMLVAALSVAASASAVPIIDFGTGNGGEAGTFMLLAGGNASGASIPVGTMTLSGMIGFNGVYDTSGAGAGDANGSAVLEFNTLQNWAMIIGGVPALGIPNGTLLLSGSFTSWVADPGGLRDAVGPDTKARLLMDAVGLSPLTRWEYFGFSLTAQQLPGGGFSVISTDFRNTAAPVPEPGSMLLLGTGLFRVATAIKRRMKK